MEERKQDWTVLTGWEKRIAVDFGSLGPVHARWSDWTWKERDIVARKVHESAGISRDHGPRSRRMDEWAQENAGVMVEFSRDGKPMPDWAHAEFRPSGVPEYVQVVWKRERPDDPASPADWAYDPPGPWTDPGEEPLWSTRPMQPGYNPNDAFAAPAEQAPEPRQATLREVYENQRVGGWRESVLHDRFGWCVALPEGGGYIRYPDEMQADETVPLPPGLHCWSPSEWLEEMHMKPNGFEGDFEGFMRWHEMSPPRPKIIGLETEGSLHSKFGGVVTYRTAANGDHIANDGTILSTRESRAKEDVPQWKKFELGRLDIVDNVVIPGPNALPRDEEQYGENRKLTKRYEVAQRAKLAAAPRGIAPADEEYSPLEKVISWARETQHGLNHQVKWCRVALAMGHEWRGDFLTGMEPAWQGAETQGGMTYKGCLEFYELHNRNARWTLAREWFEANAPIPQDIKAQVAKRDADMDFYLNAPAMQGHFAVDQWRRMYRQEPVVVVIEGWDKLAIIDPALGFPNYWLEGPGPDPVATWRRDGDAWVAVEDTGNAEAEGLDHLAGDHPADHLDRSAALPAGGTGGMVEPPLDEVLPEDMVTAARAGDWKALSILALMKV